MSKIPLIAITPEAEEDDDHNYLGMAETLTDVENLDSGAENDTEPKKRPPLSKLKIKITNSGGLTDVEDLDISDCEEHANATTQNKQVTLDDLDVNLDAAQTEETCKTRTKGSKGKKRLHTQFSVTSGDSVPLVNYLSLHDSSQGLTDVEDLDVSDNEENPSQSPDYTITEEMLENTVLTKIAFKLHDGGRGGLSPVPPKISVTDTEILDSDSNDEQNLTVNKKVKRRKPRVHRQANRTSLSFDQQRQIDRGTRLQNMEGDSENDQDKCTLKFVKRNDNITTIKIPQENDGGHTDVELLNSSADEMPVTILARLKVTDTDVESLTGDEAYTRAEDYDNIPLPEAYRKLLEMKETSGGAPSVKVTPLEESYVSNVLNLVDQCGTDEENFSDAEALLFVEPISRGPTPDIAMFDDSYEQSAESYKERSRTPLSESLTDTEYLTEKPSKPPNRLLLSKNGLLAARELDDTDVESIALSDVEEIDHLRSMSVTPTALRDMASASILSKEGVGPFSATARLEVNRRMNYVASATVTPVVTDTEDIYGSAIEDEVFVGPEVDLPDGSSHVHLQSTSRIDLDAPNDVMYLKGGDGFREVHTDVEDMNLTDTDDEHGCKYKKKVSLDILGDDKVLVSMQNTCRNRKKKSGIDWDASGKTFAERQISRTGAKPLDAVEKGWQASPDTTSPRTPAPFRETHEEGSFEDPEHSFSSQPGHEQRQVPDQHQLSEEMKQLLRDMENESKK